MATWHSREKSTREGVHRYFAQSEKGGRGAHGEVLADIQMEAQCIGEQRRGFVDLTLDLIGHLFLVEGISTFYQGHPGEVIAVGEQIYKHIGYRLQEHGR